MNIKMMNEIKSQGHPCSGCPYVFTRGGTDCIMGAVPGDCAWYFYKRLMGHTDAAIPYRIIRKAAENSGLSGVISPHSLRKTFGYYAWKQGVPPVLLMEIYHHSSFDITKRYLGIEQDDRDEVFRKICL